MHEQYGPILHAVRTSSTCNPTISNMLLCMRRTMKMKGTEVLTLSGHIMLVYVNILHGQTGEFKVVLMFSVSIHSTEWNM